MDEPVSDLVAVKALAERLDVPVAQLWLWLRAAGVQRPEKGRVRLLSTLPAILGAIRAETAEARAYRAPPLSIGEP